MVSALFVLLLGIQNFTNSPCDLVDSGTIFSVCKLGEAQITLLFCVHLFGNFFKVTQLYEFPVLSQCIWQDFFKVVEEDNKTKSNVIPHVFFRCPLHFNANHNTLENNH